VITISCDGSNFDGAKDFRFRSEILVLFCQQTIMPYIGKIG